MARIILNLKFMIQKQIQLAFIACLCIWWKMLPFLKYRDISVPFNSAMRLKLKFETLNFLNLLCNHRSRDSVVSIAISYGLNDRGFGVRVSIWSRIFLFHVVQTGSGVHPAPFPMSTKGVKLTTHLQLVPRSRKCGSTHPLPHTPSWRNAYLSTETTLLCNLICTPKTDDDREMMSVICVSLLYICQTLCLCSASTGSEHNINKELTRIFLDYVTSLLKLKQRYPAN
jgi:hypothetical protein